MSASSLNESGQEVKEKEKEAEARPSSSLPSYPRELTASHLSRFPSALNLLLYAGCLTAVILDSTTVLEGLVLSWQFWACHAASVVAPTVTAHGWAPRAGNGDEGKVHLVGGVVGAWT